MSSFRPWAFWRRLQYGAGFLLFWLLVGVGSYFVWFYTPNNCFDFTQNGNERGVDCGGDCVRICAIDVQQPQLLWSQSFEITPGQYNTVAYVENKNQFAATPDLRYTFELLDETGRTIATREGSTVMPPNSIYPIFEGRIFTEFDVPVADTRLTLQPAEMWLPASVGRGQFQARDIDLQSVDVRPRLDVRIENTALTAADNIEVVATMFNDAGEAVQTSQTFMESIAARSSQDIVFTWPQSIAKTVRSCTVPTDVVLAIDVSGSMNNDGDTPPQPITAALQAASTFAQQLQEDDQVGVVTFASDARTVETLSRGRADVAGSISSITIAAAEEQGFTNTAAALQAAQAELNSLRHNEDARRVLVLLTDGLPTAPGERAITAETEAIAEAIDEEGIEVYAVGLGDNVDQAFIRTVASDSGNAFFAPGGAELAAIYNNITAALCESGPTRIDVIAKTTTNFAPLR